jgi:7-cyano-7-deazaguanine reductase
MKGKNTVDPISLLQYIVSFRDECHFHEEICEAIYKR